MRVLVVHNQLWAHYKSILFQEIHRVLSVDLPDAAFLVAHIAPYEQNRASMATNGTSPQYDYPFVVLFDKYLESVTFIQRLRALINIYNTFRPDVLNITGYFDFAQVLLMIYAKVKGIKTVISTESSLVDKPRFGYKERIKKVILDQADAYFCFGTTTVDYLQSLGIPAKKITVKKAAIVDNDRIVQQNLLAKGELKPRNRRNFVYVGRLAPEKNLMYLLNAYHQLSKNTSTRSEWGLVFVGDGPERDSLENQVAELKLPNVSFVGGVPWQEVPYWLAKADVLVLPSWSEPWGLVVNEAMLCEMPVIVSEKCGCAKDLVQHGKNGFLIDPASCATLYEAMLYYGNHPEAVEIHGSLSKEIVAPFSPQVVAKQMVNSYRNLLKN